MDITWILALTLLTGLLTARIICTAVTFAKSSRCKKRIKIKDAHQKYIGFGFGAVCFLILTALTAVPAFMYDRGFTEKVTDALKATSYVMAAVYSLFELVFGSAAFLTEDGIITQAAFYPAGKAKYRLEKDERETFISLFTNKEKYDFSFFVSKKNESDITAAVEELYEEFNGTVPKHRRQSYFKRNFLINVCSLLIIAGGIFIWYISSKPVIFVGDKILKTNSEYAVFNAFGYHELVFGNASQYFDKLYEKSDEILENIDYTQNLTSEDMAALKQMPNLKYLDITLNSVTDLTEIGKLTQLEGFALGGGVLISKPKDYSPVGNLKGLKYFCGLGLYDLNDLTLFEDMDDIAYFELTATDIKNGLDVICEKEDLLYLNLFLCTSEDFSPIGKCSKLKHLDISETNAADLSFLKNLTELETLDISGINAEDYSVLADLPRLKRLDARYNEIPQEIIDELTEKGVTVYN